MRRFWTVPQLREFTALYPTTTMRELMARSGRSRSAIKNLAQKLGLRKTAEHLREHCRLRPWHPACGWNKGMHYSPKGAEATRFKKGQRGPRQRPVGSERITRDGVQVKVAEPDVWMPKGRAVWERAFGPIPAGAVVRLVDGNQHNCAPENLRLLTRGEHIRLNYRPKRKKVVAWLAPVATMKPEVCY